MDSERDHMGGDRTGSAGRPPGRAPGDGSPGDLAPDGPIADPAEPRSGELSLEVSAAPAATEAEAAESLGETPKERRARTARRVRLYLYVFVALALVAYLIALGAANTTSVDVSWVFGTSSVSLVWLVLSAAVLGFTLGILVSLLIRWRTRRRKKSTGD